MTDRSARARLERLDSTSVRAARRDGLIAGARRPRAHAHLSRARPGRTKWLARVSGRLRHQRLGPRRLSRRSATGSRSSRRRRRRRAHQGRAAAVQPLLAPRRRRSPPRNRSSPRTSTPCFSSAASTAISIRAGSNATCVVAWESGAHAGDRAEQGGSRRRSADAAWPRSRALAPGVAVHAVSARQPETLDAAARASRPPAEPAALLGSSGVGKSTIVNRLSATSCCGRTTCASPTAAAATPAPHRQLVLLPGGGMLIDTPGMRELQLWDTGERWTDDVRRHRRPRRACRFRDCRHRDEPGCAVTGAVAAGELPREPPRELPQARGRAASTPSGSRTSARCSSASARAASAPRRSAR